MPLFVIDRAFPKRLHETVMFFKEQNITFALIQFLETCPVFSLDSPPHPQDTDCRELMVFLTLCLHHNHAAHTMCMSVCGRLVTHHSSAEEDQT